MSALRFDILTTFPEMFAQDAGCALNFSIPARAREAGVVEWHAHDLRAYAPGKHRKTDDRPFGGGPGMVMMCQPIFDAVRDVERLDDRPTVRVLLSPQGRRLEQGMVEELSRAQRVLMIAGHYEGIDERVIDELAPMEISLGDYVLSGGELGAMVLMDAVIRLLPGVLGHDESAGQDSFAQTALPKPKGRRRVEGKRVKVMMEEDAAKLPQEARLLDCPHYTKPREWMGREVPKVLVSGDHKLVEKWRLIQRLRRTLERRPDLMTAELRGLLEKLATEWEM